MLRVGLTGGIASGKSTVADMFAGLGAGVVDTDTVAREVVSPGEPGLEAVVAEFGAEILQPNGELDRRALRNIVFSEPERRELEGVVRAKRSEPERVLLTIPTADGTLLATFTENVAEIDLLVVQGDSIALGLAAYEPFVTNPPIARVGTKGSGPAADTVGMAPRQPTPEVQAEEPIPPDTL